MGTPAAPWGGGDYPPPGPPGGYPPPGPPEGYPPPGPPGYGPTGGGNQSYGPPPQPASTGVPVWLALVIVLLAAAVVVGVELAVIKKPAHSANVAAHSSAAPANSVSTATRPPQAERTYRDPLPADVRPGWTTTLLTTDKTETQSWSGVWTPVTRAQYTAWITHLRGTGWKSNPGKRNDAANYDLIRGHVRLLGDFTATPGSVTFVYDGHNS